MIKNPVPGKWKLTTSSDDYYVTGKTSAKDDISFRCFFPFQTKLGRKTFNVKTGNPVIGECHKNRDSKQRGLLNLLRRVDVLP